VSIVFKPIEPQKMSLRVVEQIMDHVREGHLKPGDKLPAERIIAEQLGVSRPTVREALSALEIIGLVEIKTGQGAFVNAVDWNNKKAEALALLGEERSPFEVLEARRIIETDAARLACERASAQEIAEIEEAVQMLRDELASHGQWSEEADQQFHLSIVKAARNSVLMDLFVLLTEKTGRRLWARAKEKVHSIPGRSDEFLHEHAQIYEAIRERDPEKARTSILRHFTHAEQTLFAD
jgi:DNA-binding FadR family transcriptional regulator